MDYETKIYLEKLVEAVNCPDWWSVIATFVAAIVAAIITYIFGKRQEKLQQLQTELLKRQTEAQDFDIYRKLYPIVYSANHRMEYFMGDMWSALWEPTYRFEGENFLSVRIKEIDRLINELSKNRIDFELKFSKEFFDLNGYIEVLSRMSIIGHYIEDAITNGDVILVKGVHSATPNIQFDIAKHFTNPDMQSILLKRFNKYIEAKDNIHSSVDILDEIKKRCNID